MADSDRYDVLVLGSGQGGGPLAGAFSQAGRKTALIERAHIGGTCINEGCTPTKTMVASARVAHLARGAAAYGVHLSGVSVAMREVVSRKDSIVEEFRTGSEHRLRSAGVDLLMGEACFAGPSSVEVHLHDGSIRTVEAGTIVINTGARPATPPLDGLDSVGWLDSTSIMALDTVPEHLVVLGGGYVGLEFGQMFRRFGSRVTIVQHGNQLLGAEDEDVAAAVQAILMEDGIEILLDATAVAVRSNAQGMELVVRTADGETAIAGSHLLVAAGRRPNTDDLNAQSAGVTLTDRGFVQVNDRLETTTPGVYAIGDVAGSPAFTHISYDDFRILRTNLLEGGSRTTRDRLVPYTVFIDPQLGRVGLTEAQAWEQGRSYRVATMPMSHVARAIEVGETRGMIKVLVDTASDRILGCAVLGLEGGELMAVLQTAMMGGLTCRQLRDAVFAHPTLAESLNNLFAALEG